MLQISVGPENHADVVEGAFEELRQMHSGLAEEHLRVLVEDEAFVDRNDDALVDFVAVDVQSHVTTAYRYRHLMPPPIGQTVRKGLNDGMRVVSVDESEFIPEAAALDLEVAQRTGRD